jgi:hypothetical protein
MFFSTATSEGERVDMSYLLLAMLLAINLPSFTTATIVSQCLYVLTLMSLHLLTDLKLILKVRLCIVSLIRV